jgi:hypothetical protein
MSTLVLDTLEDRVSSQQTSVSTLGNQWEFVESVDCSTDSQFLFYHDGIDSGSSLVEGYDYLISCGSIAFSADNGIVLLYTTYESGAYVTASSAYLDVGYNVEENYVATTAPQRIINSQASPSYGYASWRGGNTTIRGVDGYFMFTNAADSTRKFTSFWKSQGKATTYDNCLGSGMSRREAAAAATHIKVYPSSGTMVTGRIDYLRRKAA